MIGGVKENLEVEPCLGCGQSDFSKRCFGCRHEFRYKQPTNGDEPYSSMTPAEYRTALETLGLSQLAAGRWLGVSPRTAQVYAKDGPSGPAARAMRMALRYGLND